MAEQQLPKLNTRVRFPSPAPNKKAPVRGLFYLERGGGSEPEQRVRSPQATTHRREASSGRLDRRATRAFPSPAKRLSEPEQRVRSPQATTHRREASSDRLDRRAKRAFPSPAKKANLFRFKNIFAQKFIFAIILPQLCVTVKNIEKFFWRIFP